MNSPAPPSGSRPTIVPVRLDIVCDAFRLRWLRNPPAPLEEFLSDVEEPARSELFRRLVEIDCQERSSRGERPQRADYARRFPEDSDRLPDLSEILEPDTEVSLESLEQTAVVDQPTTSTATRPFTSLHSEDATIRFSGQEAKDASGEFFADYQLLEKIAQGGMGVVYKARQAKLNRVVALKMILSGQFADEDGIRRFYAEAEAAAKLQHPNIVAVYEVGQSDGQHFYSMEFIDGESLSAVVRRNPLGDHEAAECVKQIAESMAFAHEQGILHRDLKPANVLLDPQRGPCVTDFGLAKSMHEDSGLTTTGQVLGTPSYMPPEQASGDADSVDARSDVYSIGAILYCCLTGRAPFHAASVGETIRQVLDRDPVPPRQLNPLIKRDLETICLKCLEKQPHRRYQSAEALTEELKRFLEGRPIEARPVSQWERAVKWTSRNPAWAGLFAVSALALIALFGVSFGYNRTLSEKNTALTEAVENEEAQKGIAREQASHAAQQSEVALKTLISVIDDIQIQLASVPAAHKVRTALLDEAIQGLNEVARSLENAPEAKHYLAEAHIQLGSVFLATGSNVAGKSTIDHAEEQFQLAFDVAKRLEEQDPDDIAARRSQSRAHELLAEIRRQGNDIAGALEHFRKALALLDEIGPSSPETMVYNAGVLRQKIGAILLIMGEIEQGRSELKASLELLKRAGHSDDGRVENALSQGFERLGDVAILDGEADQARTYFEESFDISKRLAERFPDDYRYRNNLATRHGRLAQVFEIQNDASAARDHFRQRYEIRKAIYEGDPNNTSVRHNYAQSITDLAAIRLTLGEVGDSPQMLRIAIELLESLSKEDSRLSKHESELAEAYKALGNVLAAVGKSNEAQTAYEQSVEHYKSISEADLQNIDDQINLALAYEYLGDAYIKRRNLQEAERVYGISLAMRQKIVDENPRTACNDRNLSVAYNKFVFLNVQLGKFAAAKSAGEKGLVIAEGLAKANPDNGRAQQDHAISLEYLGNVAMSVGDLESAREHYSNCAKIREELAKRSPGDPSLEDAVAVILVNTGALNMELGDYAEARNWFEKHLAIRKKIAERSNEDLGSLARLSQAYERMGDATGELGDHTAALRFFEKRLETAADLAKRDPQNSFMQAGHGYGLVKVASATLMLDKVEPGNIEFAKSCFAQAAEIAERLVKADPRNINRHFLLADSYEGLGDVSDKSNQKTEAIDWYRKSLKIRDGIPQTKLNRRLARRSENLRKKLTALGEPTDKSKPLPEAAPKESGQAPTEDKQSTEGAQPVEAEGANKPKEVDKSTPADKPSDPAEPKDAPNAKGAVR